MLASSRPPISVLPASWQATPGEAWQSRHQLLRQVCERVSQTAAAASLADLPSGPAVDARKKMEPSEMHTDNINNL